MKKSSCSLPCAILLVFSVGLSVITLWRLGEIEHQIEQKDEVEEVLKGVPRYNPPIGHSGVHIAGTGFNITLECFQDPDDLYNHAIAGQCAYQMLNMYCEGTCRLEITPQVGK